MTDFRKALNEIQNPPPEQRAEIGIMQVIELQGKLDALQRVIDYSPGALGIRARIKYQMERLRSEQIKAAYTYLPDPPEGWKELR